MQFLTFALGSGEQKSSILTTRIVIAPDVVKWLSRCYEALAFVNGFPASKFLLVGRGVASTTQLQDRLEQKPVIDL